MDLRSDLRSYIQVHFLLVKLDFGRTDDSSRLAHNVVVCSGQFFVDISCNRAEPLCYFFLFVNFDRRIGPGYTLSRFFLPTSITVSALRHVHARIFIAFLGRDHDLGYIKLGSTSIVTVLALQQQLHLLLLILGV